jgi:hypothetical protein
MERKIKQAVQMIAQTGDGTGIIRNGAYKKEYSW